MRPSRRSVMALAVVLAVVLIVAGVGYRWGGEDEASADEWNPGTDTPLVQLLYRKGPGNNYSFQVYRVSFPAGIENFNYFIKDKNGNTYYVGPVAIGNYTRGDGDYEIRGIEAYSTWSMKNYSTDDYDLFRERAEDVENGTGDCERYTCNVVFYDNDYNDFLSHGDAFLLRGEPDNSTSTHDIQEGWIFELQHKISRNTVASWRLT